MSISKVYTQDTIIHGLRSHTEGERIVEVGTVKAVETLRKDPKVRVIQGRGRTLMSGLGDAHTHFTWNNGDLGTIHNKAGIKQGG